MPQVSVLINGHPYTVQCGSGEERRTRELARVVDEKVAVFAQQALRAGEARLLALAALVLADELTETRDALKRLGERAEQRGDDPILTERLDRLARRIEAVASRLDQSHI